MKTDRALQTAREILTGTKVCECGHTDSEHVVLDDSSRCGECRCRSLRPLTFTITRGPDPLRKAFFRDPGALAHAVHLLTWWAGDESDEPDVIEAIKQSKEVARALDRIDRAARGER